MDWRADSSRYKSFVLLGNSEGGLAPYIINARTCLLYDVMYINMTVSCRSYHNAWFWISIPSLQLWDETLIEEVTRLRSNIPDGYMQNICCHKLCNNAATVAEWQRHATSTQPVQIFDMWTKMYFNYSGFKIKPKYLPQNPASVNWLLNILHQLTTWISHGLQFKYVFL